MASKYVIGEKNLLRIIFSNKHITLHAFNNKSAHIFCHASSQTPAIREQLLADKAAWATAQRLPTMTQKTSAVAKVFADRLRELGVPELTYERDHQRGGKQVSSCSRLDPILKGRRRPRGQRSCLARPPPATHRQTACRRLAAAAVPGGRQGVHRHAEGKRGLFQAAGESAWDGQGASRMRRPSRGRPIRAASQLVARLAVS